MVATPKLTAHAVHTTGWKAARVLVNRTDPSWVQRRNDAQSDSFSRDDRCLTWSRIPCSGLAFCIPRLPLGADSQYQHQIKFCNISIQCDIAAGTTPDHEVSQVLAGLPRDQRIAFKHIDCPNDVFKVGRSVRSLMRKEVLKNSIEIVPNLWREFNARHVYRASARGFGRTDSALDSRCSRWRRISFHGTVLPEVTIAAFRRSAVS